MVISWPEIETRSFDFTTFSIKNKPFTEAKQDYEKQSRSNCRIISIAPATTPKPWATAARQNISAT